MKIDRDGFRFAAIPAVASLVALARGHRVLAAVLGVFAAAVAAFFRDPERPADRDRFSDDVVISPADAKVTYVGPGQDGVAHGVEIEDQAAGGIRRKVTDDRVDLGIAVRAVPVPHDVRDRQISKGEPDDAEQQHG